MQFKTHFAKKPRKLRFHYQYKLLFYIENISWQGDCFKQMKANKTSILATLKEK
jgi:hypothetical protein